MKTGKDGFYARVVKRGLDFICALTALFLLSWLFGLLALFVRVKLGKPVLFRQTRPGKHGKPFTLRKFRTMTDQRDESGRLLPDELRLTRFGSLLRRSSLDELPELWNILAGSMSLVGPRPLLMEYLPYYTQEEAHRHDLRPGLTGLAQVSGRNYIDWDARLAKDVEYIRNVSLAMDMRIILKTVIHVFKRDAVAENTNAVEGNLAEIGRKQSVG